MLAALRGFRSWVRLLGLLALLALAAPGPGRAADYFGHADQTAAAPQGSPNLLPAPLRPILGKAVEWQSRLNARMRAELMLAREGESSRPAIVIVLFAFLYGVAHAIGPGHGKIVIGSYFLTRRARLVQGIAMSAVAALVQALSAIVLVGVLAALLKAGSAAILDQAAAIEMASYGAIVVLGLWMAWSTVSRRRHSHDHERDPSDAMLPAPGETLRLLATGAVVGLRPCSGAILVLLFSLANDIFAVGVLATFAMAAGVALTVSLVSLMTLGLHRTVAALGGRARRTAEAGYAAVALGGALLIALFGLLELVGVWSGALPPVAG